MRSKPKPTPTAAPAHRPQHRTATQRTHTPATLTRSDACPGHSRTSSTQATRYSSVSESSQASMDRRILSHLSSLDEVPETPNVAMDAFCDDVEDNQLVEEEEEEVDMRTDDEIFRDALLRELKRDISYTHPKERGSLINEIAKSARFIPRVSGPFMNLYNIMMDGIALLNRDDPNDTSYILRFGKKSAMDRTIAAQTFEDLMDLLPAVNINIRYISQGGNDFLNKFCRFISFNYRAARQEDTNKLKEYVVVLLGPPPAGVKPLKMKGSKSERGFNHVQSAHMLCPRILLPLFDTNPKRFMEMVKNGKVLITADAFPTFMYDEQEDFDEKNIQKGFCRSQFLLKAYRNRFTGPRSSEKETPGLIGSGKKSIAEDNNMHKVTPDSVAYIATQTCMALGTLEQFGPEEGKFSYVEFFHMIRALLSDEEDPWAVETMQWWNQWVFGINTENGTGATQDANAQDVTMIKSMAEMFAEQRIARKLEASRNKAKIGAARLRATVSVAASGGEDQREGEHDQGTNRNGPMGDTAGSGSTDERGTGTAARGDKGNKRARAEEGANCIEEPETCIKKRKVKTALMEVEMSDDEDDE